MDLSPGKRKGVDAPGRRIARAKPRQNSYYGQNEEHRCRNVDQ